MKKSVVDAAADMGHCDHVSPGELVALWARAFSAEARLRELSEVGTKVINILRDAENYAERSLPDNDEISVLEVPRTELIALADKLEAI